MKFLNHVRKQLAVLVVKALGRGGRGMCAQTVTINCGSDEVDTFWRDPEKLSQVFGNLATVRSPESDVFVWMLSGADETQTWRTRLHSSDRELRFVADGADRADSDRSKHTAVVVRYRPAPNDLGTEVTVEAATPFPDFITKAVLFKALYRARALLQTGEVPTLSHNPSAREGAH
ncbi:hypothetical protein [Rhodococcus globerulus]|jgi:uncharacterized membrane protein|uniref:hypothetical protein n=1 Tax=Rhodococcus globerulus TaxID=33008 RepID=UPI001F27E199|nr:hypothetical protein [Rhodococcus globerulus]MCE4267673.1 hypothetical protein [Rhodococcus globerulus]